jgi:hypothetical protein
LICNGNQCVPKCSPGQNCDANLNCVSVPSGCQSDAQCGMGGICTGGICFVTSSCPAGISNYECCRLAVKKACRHQGAGGHDRGLGGHVCRQRGKRRCRENFGNT